MSVTTRNPFDLLGNDAEEAAVPAPAAAQAPKEVVAKQTTSRKRDATRPSAGESRRQADSSARGGASGKKSSRPNSSSNALASNDNASRPVEPTDGQTSSSNRGRRGGARGGSRRDFDKRNASGRTDTQKATEQPWGNDAEAQQAASSEPVDSHDPAAAEAELPSAAAEPIEEEDKTVSYEDYLAQRAGSLKIGSGLNLRKANEGDDENKWGKQVELERGSKEEESYFAGTKASKSATQRERKQKEFVPIEQRFYESSSSSRGRGGESRGGRGGRGRGGGRGDARGARGGRGGRAAPGSAGSATGASISMDDSAFPALS